MVNTSGQKDHDMTQLRVTNSYNDLVKPSTVIQSVHMYKWYMRMGMPNKEAYILNLFGLSENFKDM